MPVSKKVRDMHFVSLLEDKRAFDLYQSASRVMVRCDQESLDSIHVIIAAFEEVRTPVVQELFDSLGITWQSAVAAAPKAQRVDRIEGNGVVEAFTDAMRETFDLVAEARELYLLVREANLTSELRSVGWNWHEQFVRSALQSNSPAVRALVGDFHHDPRLS